jgi:hypothetical protein
MCKKSVKTRKEEIAWETEEYIEECELNFYFIRAGSGSGFLSKL